jgi:predicted HAD superfamily phosphohydrolase YqeG
MWKRTLYALQMGWRYRHRLVEIHRNAPRRQNTLHLKPAQWLVDGVEVVVLDFDGVLAPHGETRASLEAWIDECLRCFPPDRVFILSNKPMPHRVAYFAQRYPGVRCIAGLAKKPYPAGLERILDITGVKPQALLIVDDRLLTGILAGCIVNVQVAYISAPLSNFSRRPVQESFFLLLRKGERLLLRLMRE